MLIVSSKLRLIFPNKRSAFIFENSGGANIQLQWSYLDMDANKWTQLTNSWATNEIGDAKWGQNAQNLFSRYLDNNGSQGALS